jgi:prepilin-type N-terminal cleavage/methylation domain-containing protein
MRINEARKGFTLIEVIVVFCLITFIASLGFIHLSFLDKTILHADVHKLAAICFYLQQKAIVSNTECILTLDKEHNEVRYDNTIEKLSSRTSFGFIPTALGPPGSPFHHIQRSITFPGDVIHFYPTGIISAGTVYLTDKNKHYMYALSNAVSQLSYIRLYRYDGKWKLL